MNMGKNTGVIIGVFVLAIVLVGGWYLTAGERAGMPAGSPADTALSPASSSVSVSGNADEGSAGTSDQTIASENDSVGVQDQPAGSLVSVASVTLAQSSWIAIRDEDGRVLGAGRFDAGTHPDVTVQLLRNTVSGGHYQALIYIDNGDRIFDLHTDTLVTNADGSVAGATFTALNGD